MNINVKCECGTILAINPTMARNISSGRVGSIDCNKCGKSINSIISGEKEKAPEEEYARVAYGQYEDFDPPAPRNRVVAREALDDFVQYMREVAARR